MCVHSIFGCHTTFPCACDIFVNRRFKMQGTPETKKFQSERRRVLVNRSSCPAIRPQSIPSFEIPKRPKSTERSTWSQGAYQRRRTESLTLSSTDWRVFRSELRRSNTVSSSDLTGLDFSDPGYDLSLSLKHAPHAKTSYGFPRIVISPTTTRKESLFHDNSRSKQQQHHQLGTKNQSSSVERDQEAWHYLSRPRCDSGMSDGSDFSIPTTPKSRTSTFSSISENETSPQKETKCQQLPTRLQRKFSCFNEDTHIEDWGYSSESSTPDGGSPKPTHRRFSVDPVVRGTRQRMSHHDVEDTVRQELLKQLHALCVKQNASTHRDLGEIEYWLKYDFARQTLKVLILRAENVGTTSSAERVNTYARVTLMTDSSITQQTRVIKHTRDPIYDQEITFPLEPVDVHIASLQIRVFRQRKFTNVLGGPVFLGMVNNTTLSHLLVSPTKRLREDLHAEEQMEKVRFHLSSIM